MLMALFLYLGDFRFPSTSLHDFPGTKNGILEKVMTIDAVGVFNQMGIVDVPPLITITDTRDVPRGVIDGTGYELAEFYGFWHDGLLGIWTQKRRPVVGTGSPWVLDHEWAGIG